MTGLDYPGSDDRFPAGAVPGPKMGRTIPRATGRVQTIDRPRRREELTAYEIVIGTRLPSDRFDAEVAALFDLEEIAMRIVAVLPAALAAAVLALSVPAQAAWKKKPRFVAKTTKSVPSYRREARDSGWTSFDPKDHPVGSTAWWRSMERENRGGFVPN